MTEPSSSNDHHVAKNPKASNDNAEDLITAIWDLLVRDGLLPDLVAEWPGSSAVALQCQLFPHHDHSAGPMPLCFAYVLT